MKVCLLLNIFQSKFLSKSSGSKRAFKPLLGRIKLPKYAKRRMLLSKTYLFTYHGELSQEEEDNDDDEELCGLLSAVVLSILPLPSPS